MDGALYFNRVPALGWILVGTLAWNVPCWAEMERLVSAVPGDALVAVMVDRERTAGRGDEASVLSLLSALLQRGEQMGLFGDMDDRTRLVLDGLGSVPLLARYPFAMILLDFTVAPRTDAGTKLGSISLAVVMRTGGQNEAISHRLQHLLNTHTNSDLSTMTAVPREGEVSYRLVDSRLPAWAVLQWGAVGDCYAITLGEGAFERVAAGLRQYNAKDKTDNWLGHAHREAQGKEAFLQVYADVETIERRLAASAKDRTEAVTEALHLQRVQRGLWSVRQRGRAVEIVSVLRIQDRDQTIPLTTADLSPLALDDVIPDRADSYLVLDRSARDLILRCRDLYFATLRPYERDRLVLAWEREEAAADVSFQKDLLMQLGHRVVFHNHPPHPLKIPLLCTVLIKIEGSANSTRRCLDVTLQRIGELFPCDMPGMTGGSSWLRRAEDGVWYIQFGLIGPALAVTDDWIVIGYSPPAVRQNVDYLRARSTNAGSAAQRGSS